MLAEYHLAPLGYEKSQLTLFFRDKYEKLGWPLHIMIDHEHFQQSVSRENSAH